MTPSSWDLTGPHSTSADCADASCKTPAAGEERKKSALERWWSSLAYRVGRTARKMVSIRLKRRNAQIQGHGVIARRQIGMVLFQNNWL